MPNKHYIENMTSTQMEQFIPVPVKTVKSSLVGVGVLGNRVTLWYSSPTGDSSDTISHVIECINESQAIAVSKLHKGIWGLRN